MFDLTTVLVNGQSYPVEAAIAPLLLAAAPSLIGMGGKMLGGIFGRKKKAPSAPADAYDQEFAGAVDYEKRRRNQLQGGYDQSMAKAEGGYDQLSSFQPRDYDAGAAYKEYAGGAISDMNRNISESVQKMKESGAGAGRLETGMWDEDTGDVVSEIARGTSADIARQSIAAAGITSASRTNADQMRLGALSGAAGGYGSLANNRLAASEGSSNRYLETLVGATNRTIQKQNAATQAKQNKRKGWMDFIGGAARTILPYAMGNRTLGGTPTPRAAAPAPAPWNPNDYEGL